MREYDSTEYARAQRKPDWHTGCAGIYIRSRYCGVPVCDGCGNHKGLARCYCGWSATGGDGYRELVKMGETIEPLD